MKSETDLCANCGHERRHHNMQSGDMDTICGWSHPESPGQICHCLKFVEPREDSIQAHVQAAGAENIEYIPAIPKEAAELKQGLKELQNALEQRVGPEGRSLTREIGADIIRLLTGQHGDKSNLAAMAATAAALHYIMEETEKRAMGVALAREGLPMPKYCGYCGEIVNHDKLTLDHPQTGEKIYFCKPSCREYYMMKLVYGDAAIGHGEGEPS